MPTPLRTLTRAVSVALLLAGCQSDGTGPARSPLLLDADIARLAVEGAAMDIEGMGGPAGVLGLGIFTAGEPMFDGPLAEHDLGCRSRSVPRLTVTRTCTFTDASGAPQEQYDPVTTATASIETTVEGELTHNQWSATISRSSALVVSGLAGAESSRTWNGVGRDGVSRSRHHDSLGTRAYALDVSVAIQSVVVPVPRGPEGWPLSGSITRIVSGEVTEGPRRGETVNRTATITFNGTQQVTMTVNGESFEVDLATRRTARRR